MARTSADKMSENLIVVVTGYGSRQESEVRDKGIELAESIFDKPTVKRIEYTGTNIWTLLF